MWNTEFDSEAYKQRKTSQIQQSPSESNVFFVNWSPEKLRNLPQAPFHVEP